MEMILWIQISRFNSKYILNRESDFFFNIKTKVQGPKSSALQTQNQPFE